MLGALCLALGVAAVVAPLPVAPSGHALPANGLPLRLAAWAALTLAAFATAATARALAGGLAAWNAAVLVFASAAWAMVLWEPLPVLAGSAVAGAYAILLWVRPAPTAQTVDLDGRAHDLYGGEGAAEDTPQLSLARWIAGGALLAVPAVWHPAFLFLLAGGVAATPRLGRQRAVLALLGGALLVLVAGVGLSGGWERWGADLRLPELDAHLVGWNLVWAFVGRNAGGLVTFLPLALFLFADLGDRFTLAVLGSVGASLGALVVLRPFDWLLAPSLLGAPAWVPLYAALWCLPGRSVRPRVLLWLAVPALVLAWPWLRAPLVPPSAEGGEGGGAAPWRLHLPVEATQRDLPGVRDAQSGPLRVRLLDGAAWTESVGELRMRGDRAVDLLLVSADELTAVSVEFGARATPRLEVTGATIGDTAFRPDGRVGFELRLAPPAATVPMWWSPSRQSVYRLTLRLVGGPAEPVAFSLKPGPLRRSKT